MRTRLLAATAAILLAGATFGVTATATTPSAAGVRLAHPLNWPQCC